MGRKSTVRTKRKFSAEEIDWAWASAGTLLPQMPHLSDAQRITLQTRIRERIPGSDLWSLFAPRQRFIATLTGRLRGYPSYCAARNTVFQGLAADGAKFALYRLYREGFKVINFIHDEVLVALPRDINHLAAAKRVEQIMIEEMRRVTPDLPVACEYALMRRWHKGAEAKEIDGKLVPVKPVKNENGKIIWVQDTEE